jgi:glycosyltransferase involved in cell wall biosynthesis
MTRPHIVYLSKNAILPPNRGGRQRANHLWRALCAFADVTPIIVGDTPSPPMRHISRAAQARFFPRRRAAPAGTPISSAPGDRFQGPGLWEVTEAAEPPEFVWESLGLPEALVCHCLNDRRIERILKLLRQLRPQMVMLCDTTLGPLAAYIKALGIKTVVGPHNHDSTLYRHIAAHAPTEYLQRWNSKAADAFRAAEILFAPHADQLWVCSAADARRFTHDVAAGRIRVIPNAYDVGPASPVPDGRDLMFIGQGNYYPNEQAIRSLFRVSQALDRRGFEHRMRIVGRISGDLRHEAREFASVAVAGEVPSVTPYIRAAALVPVALTVGGGTRIKILEAMAAARPVLSTPVGIEGIEAEDGVHAVLEPDLDAFPDRIIELLTDHRRMQSIATAGWELVRRNYSHQALVALVGAALRDLDVVRSGPDPGCFAENIGAEIISESLQFNPRTRHFNWTMLLRMAAQAEDVSASFEPHAGAHLGNAYVTVRPRSRGRIGLEASAVLPEDVAPEELAVAVHAWGRQVLRHAASGEIGHETAGLLTLEPSAAGAVATGWRLAEQVRVISSGEITDVDATGGAHGVKLFTTEFSGLPETIEFETSSGFGHSQRETKLWFGPYRPSSLRLGQFAGRHEGQAAWLIGNGPSVRPEDLDRLAGRLTFAFNRFYLAHPQTSLRPTYTVAGDTQMIEDFGQNIIDESGGTVLIANPAPPGLLGDYIWVRQATLYPPLFSRAADRIVCSGGSTPYVAMQIAYFMGVRKFYFYGADFSFSFHSSGEASDKFRTASGDGNHFIANYRAGKPWCPPSFKDIAASFLTARLVIESSGGFIRNVTRGGLLEMFEREDFDAALAAR